MAQTEIHKNKRKTNFAIMGLIMAFIALIYALSVVKIKDVSKAPLEASNSVVTSPETAPLPQGETP